MISLLVVAGPTTHRIDASGAANSTVRGENCEASFVLFAFGG